MNVVALRHGAVFQPRPKLLRDLLLWAVVAGIIVLDQATKFAVQAFMDLGQSIPTSGFIRFTYVTNSGGAFGLFMGQTVLLTAASFVGIGVLLLFYRTHPWPGRFVRLSLGLQLGGAIGNLIDRLYVGEVVDFIDVGPWPIFNLADSSIVVGIGLLLALFLFFEEHSRQRISPLAASTGAIDLACRETSPPILDPTKRPPAEMGC